MQSLRDIFNVLVAVALLAFIGLNLARLAVFFWQSHPLF